MDLSMASPTGGVQQTYAQYGGSHNRQYNANHMTVSHPARPQTPPSPCSTVPFSRDPHYVPRPDLTEQIDAKASVPGARVAIVGLGGAGKTQLAIEYALQVRERSPGTWVLWIHAATAARFKQSVQSIAERARIDGWQDDTSDVLASFGRWLGDSKHGKWLIVLDNVDDAKVLVTPTEGTQGSGKRLIDYLPVCEHGSMLITTRYESEADHIVYPGNIVPMGQPSQEHAVELLAKKLGPDLDGLYAELSSALDSLPLAISQAAAYIHERQPRTSVRSFLQELETSRESRGRLLARHRQLPGRDWEASSSVFATWQISFQHLVTVQRTAADLFSIMSCCDRQSIPEILIANGVGEVRTPHDFDEDISVLRKFSLISPTSDPDSWEMHRLVQDALQMWLMDTGELETTRNRFLILLNDALSFDEYSPTGKVLLPHALATISWVPTNDKALCRWAEALTKAGNYLVIQHRCSDAVMVASAARETLRATVGEEHPMMRDVLYVLSESLLDFGQKQEAESIAETLMTTSARSGGPLDVETQEDMAQLAMIYTLNGKLAEAEALYLQLMSQATTQLKVVDGISRPALSPEVWLGACHLFVAQERWSEAENAAHSVLSRNDLAFRTMQAASYDLAVVYANTGRAQEAEALMVEKVHRTQNLLGPDNPSMLTDANLLAWIYHKQGRSEESIDLRITLIARAYETLGPDHHSTLEFTYDLAAVYCDLSRLDEAKKLLASALERALEVLEEEDTWTDETKSKIAELRAKIADPVATLLGSTQEASEVVSTAGGTSSGRSSVDTHNQPAEEEVMREYEAAKTTLERVLKVLGEEHTWADETKKKIGELRAKIADPPATSLSSAQEASEGTSTAGGTNSARITVDMHSQLVEEEVMKEHKAYEAAKTAEADIVPKPKTKRWWKIGRKS